MNTIVTDVITNLRKLIDSKKDMLKNPLSVVALGMQVMNGYNGLSGDEKKLILVKALTTIANGADGVAGTNDDVLPKPIMDTITKLLNGTMIHDMINLVSDVSKGKYDLAQTVVVAKETEETCKGCFSFLVSKKGSTYAQ
jgi:hypothetical protein